MKHLYIFLFCAIFIFCSGCNTKDVTTLRIEIIKAETSIKKQPFARLVIPLKGGGPTPFVAGDPTWERWEKAPEADNVYGLLEIQMHNLTADTVKFRTKDFKALTKSDTVLNIGYYSPWEDGWGYMYADMTMKIKPQSTKNQKILVSIPGDELEGVLLRYKREEPVTISF